MQLFAGELTNQNREYYQVNDNRRYWVILSDVKQYRLYYMGISQEYSNMVLAWDTMITVRTVYHCCVSLLKTSTWYKHVH